MRSRCSHRPLWRFWTYLWEQASTESKRPTSCQELLCRVRDPLCTDFTGPEVLFTTRGRAEHPSDSRKVFQDNGDGNTSQVWGEAQISHSEVEGSYTPTTIEPSEMPQRASSRRDGTDGPLDEPADYTALIAWTQRIWCTPWFRCQRALQG